MHIYRKWEVKLGDGRQTGHMSLDVVRSAMQDKWKRTVTERESQTTVTLAPLISMGLLNSLSTMGLNPNCATLRRLSGWSIDLGYRTSVRVGCIQNTNAADLYGQVETAGALHIQGRDGLVHVEAKAWDEATPGLVGFGRRSH